GGELRAPRRDAHRLPDDPVLAGQAPRRTPARAPGVLARPLLRVASHERRVSPRPIPAVVPAAAARAAPADDRQHGPLRGVDLRSALAPGGPLRDRILRADAGAGRVLPAVAA